MTRAWPPPLELLSLPALAAEKVMYVRARKLVPVARKERVEGRTLLWSGALGPRSDAKKGKADRMRFHGKRTAAPSTKNGSVGGGGKAGALAGRSDAAEDEDGKAAYGPAAIELAGAVRPLRGRIDRRTASIAGKGSRL